MKNIVLVAIGFLLCTSLAMADGPIRFEVVREVDMPKDAIYQGANQWIAEKFVSAKRVIELQDQETGTIIGNGISQIPGPLPFTTMPLRFKLRIDMKDGKLRMTFTNFELVEAGNKPIEYANRQFLEPKAGDMANSLADNLATYLRQRTVESDW